MALYRLAARLLKTITHALTAETLLRIDCRDTARIDCRDTAEATQEVCRSTSADQQQRVSDTIHGLRPKSAYLLPDIVHQTAAGGVLHDKVEDVVGEVHVQQADDAGMLQA